MATMGARITGAAAVVITMATTAAAIVAVVEAAVVAVFLSARFWAWLQVPQ